MASRFSGWDDADVVRMLYARHRVEEVSARRSVNSVGSKSGAVTELLVSGGPDAR